MLCPSSGRISTGTQHHGPAIGAVRVVEVNTGKEISMPDAGEDLGATFTAIVGDLEYPMFIVTATADGEPLGCLIGFATQMSIDPPRFVIGLSHNNRTFRRGQSAEAFGVHCVPAHATALAELFGGETTDEVDKFARCEWHEGPEGVPILEECGNWFVGRVVWRADAGDHDAFLLEAIAAQNGSGEDEFTFHRAKRIDPGHEA
jgi:flavin reductase (DIM6/NTAB) family NADH-FMN oxidoreductase RutF